MIPEFWRSITGDAPPMETRIVNDNAGWKEEPLTGDAQEVAAMIDSLIDAETRVEVRIGPSDKAISAGGGVAYGTHSPTAMNVEVDISALDAMVPAQFADGKIGETSIESIEMALVHELGHAYAKVTGASPWYSAELFYAVYYENVYRRGTAQEPGKQPIRILERPRRGDDPLEGLTYDERATMELMIDRFRRNPDENQK